MRLPHWVACRWERWELYETTLTETHTMLSSVSVARDVPLTYTELRERRRCAVCGRTQDRMVSR
jgi:hypothetical protein